MKIKDTILGGKYWRWIVSIIMIIIFILGITQCKAQCTQGSTIITGGTCNMSSIPVVPSGETRMECFLFKPETEIIHLNYMLAQGSNCGPIQYNNLQVYIYDSTCTTLEHYSNIYPTQTNLDAVLDTTKWYQMCVNFTASCTLTAICPQYNLSYLPVTLSEFDLKGQGNFVQVHWRTESETNSDYFQLERADTNHVFIPIFKQYSQGNSSTPTEYNYLDRYPKNGINYYRLVQVDIDGTVVQYPPKAIRIKKVIPSEDFIWIYYDELGRQLKDFK